MKKNIFYKIKSVQEYCLTFSNCLKADFLSFLTHLFAKKLIFYIILLFGLGFTPNSYGQLVGGAAVKANFGIDGDVYANVLQFGSLPNQNGTDDWFQTTYPGPGFGVIDQSQPYPVIDNTAFSRRQSITTPTAPYPFPIVHSGIAPNDADYLWLDAVYGRDNYVKGGNAEKSYFAGSGDKNSDNPVTWQIGTSGSVPQKDDIIDVYAHLRGEGPRIPFTPPGNTDPRPFTTLWAYAAASIVVTNGNKHVDFEFFRTALSSPGDLTIPGKTGPDGGRTAFTFNADGSVAIPGTIIISVDYINGGTVPQVRIRVWMDEAVFNSYDNSALLRPFTVDKATAFEKGTSSGTFGYAAILENVGATNIFGRVNDNASTLGPPWGTFAGTGPTAVTDYQALQFVEIGINLTAFGLDKRGTQDPCSNILGSLLVKTRSSGGGPTEGAFGSELKDFAGPFLFGNTGTPPVVSVPPKTVCSGSSVDLTTGATTTGGTIHYYLNSDYTGEILTPTNFTPTATGTIYVRSESLSNPGCFGTSQFTVTVNPTPNVDDISDVTLCSDAGGFTLPTITGTNLSGNQAYFTGSGGTGTQLSVGTVISSTQTIYIYDETKTTPNCTDEESFTVTINQTPNVDDLSNVTLCSDAGGYTLPTITGTNLTGNQAYFTGSGGTGTKLAVGTVINSSQTIYIYDETKTTPNCTDQESFTVTINQTPNVDDLSDVTLCSDAGGYTLPTITGTNLTGNQAYFTGSGGTGTKLAVGTVISSSQTIYIYDETKTTPNCTDQESFTVTVNQKPNVNDISDVTLCSDAGGFTLPTITGTNLTGNQAYYTGSGGTGTKLAVGTVINSTQTIYIYDETKTTPNCTDEESFTVTINQTPNVDDLSNVVLCADAGGYTLPTITGTNLTGNQAYFTGSGGTGTKLAVGTVINSNQTIYIYDETKTTPNCTDEESFTVTINPNPTCSITGEQTVCTGASSTFTATAGMTSYAWTGPGGFTASTQSITVSVAGIYEVTITDANGCSSKCSRELIVQGCGAGCTIGFWKNHTDLWDGVSPDLAGIPFITSTNFFTYFGLNPVTQKCNLPNGVTSMIGILNISGGGCRSLARQAVAAALNESVLDNYDYPGGLTQLKIDVYNAFNSCSCNSLAVTLEGLNNREGTDCSALTKLAVPLLAPAQTTVTGKMSSTTEIAGFDAYPVPFKDQLTIKYKFDYVSDVKIDVFNAQGVSILSKADANSYLNKEITLNLNAKKGQEQVYIVKVTTNRGSSSKKVVSSK